MCEHLEAEGMVGMVDQRVAGLLREWLASRMTGLNEETRVIAQRIIDKPVVWVVHGRTVSGGKIECEAVDFEGKTKSVNCEVLWQQVEYVAQQYGWTVNHMSAYLVSGHSLKGQAKEVLKQAKLTGDPVLCSKAPLVGDIVTCLLRYYQLKFRYLILVGKPTQGAVINK